MKHKALAIEFCRILKDWLTESEFADIVKKNGTPDYPIGGACPSHDYCDANVAMDEAFEKVTGKPASDDLNDDATLNLWDQAWTLARRSDYNVTN